MKKRMIFATLSMTLILFSFSFGTADKEYEEIHYASVEPMETDQFTLTVADMHSQETFCLVRAEMTNKTDDYIFIELDQVKFTLPDGSSASPGAKRVKIKPNATKKFTVKSAAVPGLPAKSVKVEIAGITLLPVDGSTEDVESYPLPDTKKKVQSENLTVTLSSLKKETRVTEVKWKVMNSGKSPVLVNPSVLTVTCEGNEGVWACESKAADYDILWPGKKTTLKAEFRVPGKIVDMQFANMLVHWNKAFIQSAEEPIDGVDFGLEMDLGKTEGMNK